MPAYLVESFDGKVNALTGHRLRYNLKKVELRCIFPPDPNEVQDGLIEAALPLAEVHECLGHEESIAFKNFADRWIAVACWWKLC